MTLQTIAVDVSARRIATVLLNRPERGNAFDQIMLDELGQTFTALGADDGVRIVVLRASGRHFCSGADLAARAAAPPAHPSATAHVSLRELLARLDALPKPTLAVVHGAIPAIERTRAMGAFRRGEAQVLVGTTVLEVGIDVPEATLMVVDGAERFGLPSAVRGIPGVG